MRASEEHDGGERAPGVGPAVGGPGWQEGRDDRDHGGQGASGREAGQGARASIGSSSVGGGEGRGLHVRGRGWAVGGPGQREGWYGRDLSRGDSAGMDRWGDTSYGAGSYGGSGWRYGGDLDDRGPVGASGARVDQGFRGRGPRGYTRPDERIREDIGDRLTDHPGIDASDIEVQVKGGEVTLTGAVDQRSIKYAVEQLIDGVTGVLEIHNQLRVKRPGSSDTERAGSSTGAGSKGAAAR